MNAPDNARDKVDRPASDWRASARRWTGLVLGLAAFALLLWLPGPAGMTDAAWRVTAVASLMAIWWVTEALPLPATALVPIVLFPVLGIAGVGDATAPYANPLIFLFLGGFVLGLALQRWNLHRRIALGIVARIGTRPDSLVGGFMVATAFLSMWVSNTATAVMMLPVALSVIGLVEQRAPDRVDGRARNAFAVSLLLAVAYAASIGGLGTLIGTPPNALLAGYFSQTYGVTIGFAQWMVLGVPLVVLMLALAWWLLTRVLFRVEETALAGAGDIVRAELSALGPMSTPERLVAIVFAGTAAAWILRPLLEGWVPGLDDTVIAIAAALVLFIVPSGRGGGLMDWDTARELPWGVLLLFGGGLTLAAAIADSGLATWLGDALGGLGAYHGILIVLVATLGVIFLTELTSNTATAAAFIPIVGSVAVGIGMNPFLLTVPVALAASCAFMLPVATPPNAIVYASGHLHIAHMVRAGLWLNLAATALIVALAYAIAGWLFSAPEMPGPVTPAT
ncbi:DASS family sodium-coupled anion symporter [Arenibaculum sp.]|jgi:sodium-dependent dicarboxylate transporter 2/3/5|uniref:SLC13 family permease n=1 Tax=Arenibaculum sp. TaxID=2865862 RepID=UPI002E127AE2|nr:DASS family sodium-coupled anion symporter [Arenibaculum sp.]